jgi:hypothetical protein
MALLVLKELQNSGKIEIVSYQGREDKKEHMIAQVANQLPEKYPQI